jgi:cob(I)alamin adenosyltransferase
LKGKSPRVSIVTKTGDSGTTALMYNRRVPKHHPRIDAVGAIDELNSAIGMARATAKQVFISDNLKLIQSDLITVMGEIAVATEDLERYERDGFARVTPTLTAKLEALVRELEAQNISFKGWATPGDSVNGAALDMARSICRRAERHVSSLQSSGDLINPEILIFLNRLADLLWLCARYAQ